MQSQEGRVRGHESQPPFHEWKKFYVSTHCQLCMEAAGYDHLYPRSSEGLWGCLCCLLFLYRDPSDLHAVCGILFCEECVEMFLYYPAGSSLSEGGPKDPWHFYSGPKAEILYPFFIPYVSLEVVSRTECIAGRCAGHHLSLVPSRCRHWPSRHVMRLEPKKRGINHWVLNNFNELGLFSPC